MSAESDFLSSYRSHNYEDVMVRWRAIARGAKLVLAPFIEHDGHPIFSVRSREVPDADAGGMIYLSAGVHGDEAGGVAGLLRWAEANVAQLKCGGFMIFPCLNPAGFIANTRADADGSDLNRNFDNPDDPVATAWRKVIEGMRFRGALNLHEDYDAGGLYLYEHAPRKLRVSEQIVAAASRIIPADRRRMIEGRWARGGIIRPRKMPNMDGEMPEALWLAKHHTDLSVTFETPSEYNLYARARAQAAAVGAFVKVAKSL